MPRRPTSVVELAGYLRRADEVLSQDEQDAIIDLVAYEPTCGDVIKGTGGLRKVRVGRGSSGKRGGARVVYYFHDVNVPVLLLAVYAKNERSDLSAADKKQFAAMVKEIVAQWQGRK
jgi:mRNA-degrading endonuclease RelE of RelBE toxin-antitoxin system